MSPRLCLLSCAGTWRLTKRTSRFNYSNESTQFQTGALTSQSAYKQHSRRVAVHTHAASAAHTIATVRPNAPLYHQSECNCEAQTSEADWWEGRRQHSTD